MRVCKRAVTLLLLLLWCLSVAASAAVTTDYVLDDGEKRPIPRPYVPVRTLSVTASTGRSLNAPQDLFLAPSGIWWWRIPATTASWCSVPAAR